MNQLTAKPFLSDHAASSEDSGHGLESFGDIEVGDVLIRRDESGYAIYNYRGERILDRPIGTASEAQRLAAEIVAPWQGHVRSAPDSE